MKTPHLGPALAAVLLLIAGLIGGSVLIHSVAQRYIHALAATRLSEIIKGSLLQQIAAQQPDLLLVYGSSEMIYHGEDYGADVVFCNCPTGFIPFEIEHRAQAPAVPWAKIIGMRHILVHDYFGIDTAVVWEVVARDLPELRRQMEDLLATMRET